MQVMVNQNKEAEKYPYTSVGVLKISPNQQILVYVMDTTGEELWDAYILNLETKEVPIYMAIILLTCLKIEVVEKVVSVEWDSDGKLYYTRPDKLRRPYRVSHPLTLDFFKKMD